jgi:hypothetical protein
MTLRAWVQENPGKAITAAALTGGAIVYLALKILTGGGTGDEPPIRVKGGSLELDLMVQKGTDEWMRDTDQTHIAKNGKRNGKKIVLLTLPPSNDNNCDKWLWRSNDEITVTFFDKRLSKPIDVKFNVKEHGNANPKDQKTTVPSITDLPFAIGSDPRHLSNSDPGYISKVTIGTNLTCTYQEADKAEIILFE